MKVLIEEIRKRNGITQEELAEKSGVSRATIIAIENGENVNTTTKTLSKLAAALDTTVAQLFLPEVFDESIT